MLITHHCFFLHCDLSIIPFIHRFIVFRARIERRRKNNRFALVSVSSCTVSCTSLSLLYMYTYIMNISRPEAS